jgi:hypothetical protein
LNQALVGEVAFGGQLDESLHEGAQGGVSLDLLLDHLEVALDLLDLDEGGVAQLTEEAKALVDGGDGVVGLTN